MNKIVAALAASAVLLLDSAVAGLETPGLVDIPTGRSDVTYQIDAGRALYEAVRYPEASAKSREEDTVRVRVEVLRSGETRSCAIAMSGGYKALDGEVLRACNATRFPPLPADVLPQLPGAHFFVNIQFRQPFQAMNKPGRRSPGLIMNSCKEPTYPSASVANQESGVVGLVLSVDSTGHVTQIQVASSSKHARLDEAAASAMRSCRFAPALEHGRPAASRIPLNYRWFLPDEPSASLRPLDQTEEI